MKDADERLSADAVNALFVISDTTYTRELDPLITGDPPLYRPDHGKCTGRPGFVGHQLIYLPWAQKALDIISEALRANKRTVASLAVYSYYPNEGITLAVPSSLQSEPTSFYCVGVSKSEKAPLTGENPLRKHIENSGLSPNIFQGFMPKTESLLIISDYSYGQMMKEYSYKIFLEDAHSSSPQVFEVPFQIIINTLKTLKFTKENFIRRY